MERVRHRTGGNDDDLAIGRGDGFTNCAPNTQEVIGLAGLADTDGQPLLVEAFAKVGPQVDGRVVQRQVLVIDRRDPGAVRFGAIGDGVGQLRVAAPLVRNAAHAARKFFSREEAGPAIV